MRLFKFGKIKETWNEKFTIQYYVVRYVNEPEEYKEKPNYVYTLLYDTNEWEEKNLPNYIDVEFKTKISKKFTKHKIGDKK